MSDNRRVIRDTKHGAGDMSETAVFEARSKLEALMVRHHRGPHDTWTAARERVAREIGVEPAPLHRLWQRWQTMKDVSGGVLLALQLAYKAECEKHERAADHYRAMRERIENGRSTGEIAEAPAVGVAASDLRSTSPSSPGRA